MRLDEFTELSSASVSGVFNTDGTTEIACEGFAIGLLLIATHLIEHVADAGANDFSEAIEMICFSMRKPKRTGRS